MTNLLTRLTKLLTVATASAIQPGHNSYNAAGGALAPVLPALTGSGAVATLVAAGKPVRVKVSKSKSDTSVNAVTVTCAGSDTFEGGATAVALMVPGEKLTLSAETLPGASGPVWVTEEHTAPRDMLDVRYALVAAVQSGFLPVAHLTATDPHGDRAYSDAQLALLTNDPLGLGFVSTFPPGVASTNQTWPTANNASFVRVISGGTITKIGVQIPTASGNVCVAAFSGTGAGKSRKPGALLASSGSVGAVAGYQEIALGASVTVAPGDFLALACDNTTIVVTSSNNGSTNNLYAGMSYSGASAFPLASSPTVNPSGARPPMLTGVA